MTPFLAGKNTLRVVATRGKTTVTDQISFIYQTDTWDKAAELKLTEKSRTAETVTVEAKVYDSKGVLCLDARNQVHFSIAGAGKLLDNRGTSRGSRVVSSAMGARRSRCSATMEDRLSGSLRQACQRPSAQFHK